MSRADNDIDGVDDEFTKEAKQAANAAEDDAVADDVSSTKDVATDSSPADKPANKSPTSKASKEAPAKTSVDKQDRAATKTADKPAAKSRREKKPPKVASGLNPTWWAPVMVGLMVIGLIWLVVFYLSSSKFPIPGISYWNLAIGFVLMMAGFAMTTRWK